MKNQIIIDAHEHVGYIPNLMECQQVLLRSNKTNKITFSLFSFDGSEFQANNDRRTRLVNQIIGFNIAYEFSSKHPDNFGMLCWIRPHTESNLKEVEAFIEGHKNFIYGLKFHPFASQLRITDQKLIPYLRLAEKYNLPVLVHTAVDKYSKIKYLQQVCKQWPHLNFIAAHAELYSDHQTCIKAMKECLNLYCDTAWVEMNDLLAFKKEHLLDRVIFGTDNPIDGEGTLKKDIYKKYFKNEIQLDENEYNDLMYKNAVRVYQIPKNKLKK